MKNRELKTLADKLLEQFKTQWNKYEKDFPQIESIELFSGIKPDGYFLPSMFFGRNSDPKKMDNLDGKDAAWYVELFINDMCVFRDSRTRARREVKPDADLQYYEEFLLERLLYCMTQEGLRKLFKGTMELHKSRQNSGI